MNKITKKYYSKEDRIFFRDLIIQRLRKSKKDLAILKESFLNNKNNGTEDTSPTFKAFEEGSETLSKEQNAQLISHLQKLIVKLELALIRVNNVDFGICEITKNLIPKERLIIIPYTTLSIEGQRIIEKQTNIH